LTSVILFRSEDVTKDRSLSHFNLCLIMTLNDLEFVIVLIFFIILLSIKEEIIKTIGRNQFIYLLVLLKLLICQAVFTYNCFSNFQECSKIDVLTSSWKLAVASNEVFFIFLVVEALDNLIF
jgi:hypothetical protein